MLSFPETAMSTFTWKYCTNWEDFSIASSWLALDPGATRLRTTRGKALLTRLAINNYSTAYHIYLLMHNSFNILYVPYVTRGT
jgi:hypothetical protein